MSRTAKVVVGVWNPDAQRRDMGYSIMSVNVTDRDFRATACICNRVNQVVCRPTTTWRRPAGKVH